jgi:hypothetical protein
MSRAASLFRTSLALLGMTLFAPSALSSVTVSIEQDGFGSGRIEVTSKDGKSWTDITPGTFGMGVKVGMGISNGELVSYKIKQPATEIYYSGEFIKPPDFVQKTVSLTGSTQNFILESMQILNVCNNSGAPSKKHEFWHFVNLTLEAHFTHKNGTNYPPHEGYGTVPVKVVCKAALIDPDADLAVDLGNFKVETVQQFLSTYSGNKLPGDNPGTVCPALKVTSRAETSKAGPVKMRIWRQKNGGAITSVLKNAAAKYDAVKNGYFATVESVENAGVTSNFKFMTEIEGNGPFSPSTQWKDITVHCAGAGGGGLASEPQDNPDVAKPQANWQGEATVADSAAAKKSCPRKGQVSFSVMRGGPGDFKYRVGCSNGAFFSGTATGLSQGGPNHEAYGAHDLSINRTRTISCTVQEILANGKPVTVATAKKDFTCNNPAVDPDADELVSDPPAAPSAADTASPGKVIVLNPVCPRGEKLLNGACVKKPQVSIFCKPGFVLKGKACIRKLPIVIVCKSGFTLKGKKCVRAPVIKAVCIKSEKLVRGSCVKMRRL